MLTCIACIKLAVSGSKKLPHEKLPSKALKLAKLLLDKIDCRDNEIHSVMEVAVEEENIEFFSLIICDYPELICKIDRDGRIFGKAVLKRQKDIFKLLMKKISPSFTKKMLQYKDPNGNNILHLAGMSASSDQLDTISGVALQLQHELWWSRATMATPD
ncbi:hypothetical protein Pint_10996 [Pistacia integerrima]|uniref:Uncharacterized protein n=1 Tax=Pistacia integerrima TaxID=434235 RepID=A0ACC0XEM4_9ROSI|nr:hypothetical protein Pint_10996 [Pistacia integerrima]